MTAEKAMAFSVKQKRRVPVSFVIIGISQGLLPQPKAMFGLAWAVAVCMV